ncbi:MAG: 16S rRNA (guanine(527)-N(7))-methyltransferase RsmG [Alphaproteobacteria bacterium]|nr:16S rRNA (guanine(527)-N(7))-methyltransferase RsmG [Alphaproteobacteria bacterium]
MKHPAAAGSAPDALVAQRLQTFATLLLHWNRRINLIARGDAPLVWERHIDDSAQLAPLLPPRGGIVDLGSGAGFPGLVLSIVTGRHADLIEADQRKCAFLRTAARACAADVLVHAVRAEAAELPPAAVVTARGFAPVRALLPIAARLLAPDGVALLLKGRSAEEELTAARGEWHMHAERFPSRTSPGATILRISEIRRAAAVS